MRLTNKGQAGTVITVIIVLMTIVISALILQSLSTALGTGITGAGHTYNTTWTALATNAVTGMNLTTLLPLLLGAGALIMAVYSFAKR